MTSDDREPLTARQRQVYDFVEAAWVAGQPPTFREIMREFGFSSCNAAKIHTDALIRKGWLHCIADGKARSLRPTRCAIANLRDAAYNAAARLEKLGDSKQAASLREALAPFERRR